MEEKKITDEEILKALKENYENYQNFDNPDIWVKYFDEEILKEAVGLIQRLQCENERLNDMKFTQEHCNLYEENEWLKDMLRQYMNGEIVNENVFAQQVEDIKQVRKEIAKEILIPLICCEKQIDPLKTGIRWSILKSFCKKFDIEVELCCERYY